MPVGGPTGNVKLPVSDHRHPEVGAPERPVSGRPGIRASASPTDIRQARDTAAISEEFQHRLTLAVARCDDGVGRWVCISSWCVGLFLREKACVRRLGGRRRGIDVKLPWSRSRGRRPTDSALGEHSVPTGEQLLAALRSATDPERSEILSRLHRKYLNTGSLEDLNFLGLGLVQAQRFANAARVFQRLVALGDAYPQSVINNISLGSVYEDLGWYACSEYQRNEAMRGARDEEIEGLCRNELEHLSEVVNREQAEAEFQRLKFECAVETIALGSVELVQYEHLARTTRDTFDPDPEHGRTAKAQSLLECAAVDYPDSTELLHALLHCCLVLRDSERRDELMRMLEDLEPESIELSLHVANVAAGSADPALPKSARSFLDLHDLISADPTGADRALRLAAVSDLRALARRYPCSLDICTSYAYGLMQTGQLELLRDYVGHLRLLKRPEHNFHYNFCQFLQALGKPELARHHLDLAMQFATTPEERSDAAELRGRFESE